jgi:peptidyl-prolyl cis-trans isomerase B (cyclophilin B)
MSKAIIKTEKGNMTVQFYDKDAPNTVANFKKLANEGFYDGVTFHRVINDFVIQGGCPNSKDPSTAHLAGTGGPGYKIDCETSGENQHHERGVLSMAHAGKNTGGSQFFVCHSRTNTAHLDGVHTVFGKVVENVDIVDDIKMGDRIIGVEVIED